MIGPQTPTRVPLSVLLAVLVGVMTITKAQAGGAKVPNQSTRAMGMSDAFVAGADDASAVYYNPAGLTRLKGAEVITNLYVAHSTIYGSGPGADVTSDGRVYVLPTFYLGLPLDATNATTLGLGIYTPFGLGSRWGDDVAKRWATLPGKGIGETSAKLAEIQMVNINPVIARRLTDSLSVGVGLDYYVSRAITRGEMNYSPFGGPGEVDLDVKGDGIGFNGGLQWQCSKTVIIGLVARSEVEVKYEGDLERDGVPVPLPGAPGVSSHAETTIDYPLSLAAGVRWLVTDRLRLEFAAEWMEWSRWDERTVKTDDPMLGPSFTSKLDWTNSWILMSGLEYDLTSRWTVRAGYSYNQTPVRASRAQVDLPNGDVHVLALGVGYHLTESVDVDAATNLAYGETRTLNHSSAPRGTDFDAISTYFSLGVRYRF